MDIIYFLLLPLVFENLVASLNHDDYRDVSDNHHRNGDEDTHNDALEASSTATDEVCLRLRSGQLAGDENIESCFHIGYKFLGKYIRSTRIKKANGNNKCNLFKRFQTCFLAIYNKCSHTNSSPQPREHGLGHLDEARYSHSRHDLLEIWWDVIDHVQCQCNPKCECRMEPSCMFSELDGFWAKRCDDFYKFNVEQKTKHQCHFFEENIQCKTALVRTGCNPVTADFASSLLNLMAGNETHWLQCPHARGKKHHKVFSYTEECKPRLIQEIDNCSAMFTSQNIVEFYEDNDLISQDSKKSLKTACRTVQKFNSCMEPLRATCAEGVQRVLDYQEDLRRYLLKMNYICSDSVYSEFRRELECYQAIMSNSTLKQCSHLWMAVKPWQQDITAYQFYCQPNHLNTVNLIKELNVVGQCHDDIFKHQCGATASKHMKELFHLAFRDPFYLRLSYKPDCSLHYLEPDPVDADTSTPSFTPQTREDNFTSSNKPYILSSPSSVSDISTQTPTSASSTLSLITDIKSQSHEATTESPQFKTRHSHDTVTVLRVNDDAWKSGSSTIRRYNSWRTLILQGMLLFLILVNF